MIDTSLLMPLLHTAHALLRGEETDIFADSGNRCVDKREEIQAKYTDVNWHIPMSSVLDKQEQIKTRICAKVEHPFRVIK